MAVAPVKVFASRDFKSYRPVSSPVAAIAHRFFTFAAGNAPECAHARYAYATAYLGREPPVGAPFAGSELDEAVRTMLQNPPVVVLAQGPMQPWGLFGPEREAERQSIVSTASGGVVVEPVSAVRFMCRACCPRSANAAGAQIFLPWSVHQALKDATDADDAADVAAASFFLMAGVIHETAHWIAANVSQGRRRPCMMQFDRLLTSPAAPRLPPRPNA
jgi:hypothetical protein